MRLLRIRVERFGPLTELDSGHQPLPGLVAVQGPNEAGKTSFFHAIRVLLHGFYPASRQRNPRAPWDGSDAELRAWLAMGGRERREGGAAPTGTATAEGKDTGVWEVHRRLLATPWGRLSRNGDESVQDLRNDAVPGLEHVPRSLYEEVFTITLPQLAALQDQGSWATVRDRLVTGMVSSELKPPSLVADELEKEARELWKSRRNKGSHEGSLAEEERELRGRLTRARDRDRAVRQAADRLEEVKEELDRLKAFRSRLNRLRGLLPWAERLARLQRLRDRAGDPAELRALPDDPPARLHELRKALDEARSREEEGRRRVEEVESAAEGPEPGIRELLERGDEVRALVAEAPVVRDREQRASVLGSRRDALSEEMAPLLRDLLEEPDDPAAARKAGSIPVPELRLAMDRWGRETERLRRVQEEMETAFARSLPPEPSTAAPPGLWAAGGAAGVMALMGGLLMVLSGPDWLFPLGLTLLVAAVAAGGAVWTRWAAWKDRVQDLVGQRRAEEEAREALSRRRDELESGARRAAESVRSLLADLPIRPTRLQEPDPQLPRELEEIRRLLRDQDAVEEELRELERKEGESRDRLAVLSERVEDLALPAEPATAFAVLEDWLDRAHQWAENRRTWEQEGERARDELRRARSRMNEAEEELKALEAALVEATEEALPPEAAAQRARERKEAFEDSRRILRELEEEFGSVEALEGEVEEARRAVREELEPELEEALEDRLEERLQELDERLSDLQAERGSLATVVGEEGGEETVDVLESSIREIQEERARARRERDRLWTLARVVRRADDRFRDAHQPELLRRAGRYLQRITEGRYRGLRMAAREGGHELRVLGEHLPDALPVEEPLSTGIREQIYLALRLAVVEMVEGDGTPLPLVLDEILVNWDEPRRRRGLELLAELSASRQIFLLTCHPAIAAEVEALGGRRIQLPRPRPRGDDLEIPDGPEGGEGGSG